MSKVKNSSNIVTGIINRESQSNKRESCSRELEIAIEENAGTCEFDELTCKIPENTRSTFLISFSPDCSKVASAHGNHNIYVCDVNSGHCLQTLEGHSRTPWSLTFHPTLEVLASGCLAGQVRIWNLQGKCEVWNSMKNIAISSLSFHPSDRLLAIATNNEIFFWDWSQPKPFASCKTSCERERVRLVRFDSFGSRLFTGIANINSENRQREFASSCVLVRESGSIFRPISRELQQRHGRRQDANSSPATTGNRSADENEELFNTAYLQTRVLEFHERIMRAAEQLQNALTTRNPSPNVLSSFHNLWEQQKVVISTICSVIPRLETEVVQSYCNARGPLMDYLNQLQEMMHNMYLVNELDHQQEILRRKKRSQYIYNLFVAMFELVTLDIKILLRLSTNLSRSGNNDNDISLRNNSSFHIRRPIDESREDSLRRDIFVASGMNNLVTEDDNLSLEPQQTFSISNLYAVSETPTSNLMMGADSTSIEDFRQIKNLLFYIVTELRDVLPVASHADRFHNQQTHVQSSLSTLLLPRSYSTSSHQNSNRIRSHRPIGRSLWGSRFLVGTVEDDQARYQQTYRIQYWNISQYLIPNISNALENLLIRACSIQNDASFEISNDNQLLAALLPSFKRISNILAIYSISQQTFGQRLYTCEFSESVISISFSPLGRYVLVGLGSTRYSVDINGGKVVMGQILKLTKGTEAHHITTLEFREEDRSGLSVNCLKWIPSSGRGFVSCTNRGELRIYRPRSFTKSKRKVGKEFIGLDSWPTITQTNGSFTLCLAFHNSSSNVSSANPSTSTTATQYESEQS